MKVGPNVRISVHLVYMTPRSRVCCSDIDIEAAANHGVQDIYYDFYYLLVGEWHVKMMVMMLYLLTLRDL